MQKKKSRGVGGGWRRRVFRVDVNKQLKLLYMQYKKSWWGFRVDVNEELKLL